LVLKYFFSQFDLTVNFDQTMLKSTPHVNLWFIWIFDFFSFFFLLFKFCTCITPQLYHVPKWFNLISIFVKLKQYCPSLHWHSI